MPERGCVFLVGAGPGDPGLLTLRGAELLRSADVVVHDALVDPSVLDLAAEAALRINVGKRGHEAPTRTQDETQKLLIEHARAGRRVVRLKGGDPFVFGRGGEEASALRAAGVPFEIVPGVSSAIGALAYAGIPVTDRRHAASFAVVTGHRDPSEARERLRWAELARGADTLVVLMGMSHLDEIATRLLEGGRDGETPAAVIQRGSTPEQRVVTAPLGSIAAVAREAGIGAPAALAVGDVVALRDELGWYERRPLFGRRVLVTRTPEQAGPLRDALRAAGASPVLEPMIRIEPIEPAPELVRALSALGEYQAAVLTSANGARALASHWSGAWPVSVPILCVGPATRAVAEAAGLPTHPLATERHDAEALLAALCAAFPVEGRRFLLPGAEAGREILADGLRAAGGQVDAIAVYRTLPAASSAESLCASLIAEEFDTLTFASPSAARHFAALLDEPAREAARRCVIAAIGRVTAQALREVALPPDVVPERSGAEALVEALVAHARDPKRSS